MVLRGDGPNAGSIPVLISSIVKIKDISSGLKAGLDLYMGMRRSWRAGSDCKSDV